MDDLDELERDLKATFIMPMVDRNRLLALIERCRKAKAEAADWRGKYESTLAGYHAFARENGVEVWRRLYSKVEAERDKWPAAVAKVRGRYPEEAFPPEGKSLDCNSARMARLACDEITRLATEPTAREEDA